MKTQNLAHAPRRDEADRELKILQTKDRRGLENRPARKVRNWNNRGLFSSQELDGHYYTKVALGKPRLRPEPNLAR